MGRKPLPPNQRALPISFSLKPHLIAKIDNYASDMRFSRSKFLMQAVTEYMTRNIVNPNDKEYSSNTNDMSLTQKVAVGLEALKQANLAGETISKAVLDALRRELKMDDPVGIESEEKLQESKAVPTIKATDASTPNQINIVKSDRSEYIVHADQFKVAKIFKVGKGKLSWVVEDIRDGEVFGMFSTLRDAKENAEIYYEQVKVR